MVWRLPYSMQHVAVAVDVNVEWARIKMGKKDFRCYISSFFANAENTNWLA